MSRTLLPLLFAALSVSSFAAADGGVRTASMLANTCAGCHGTGGASTGEYMPSIGGMDKGYLFSVLSDYKTGVRGSTIMGRIMKGYGDREIWAIASFYADQPWVSTDAIADARLAGLGGKIHDDQCETCHKDGGRGQDDESPRLAGQWTGYTHYALEACRSIGKRCAPRKMGERVKGLSNEELEALATFYASQK